MNEIRLSASARDTFKACPMRFLYQYSYGLQPAEEKDSLRIGTTWHRCHEIMNMPPEGKCPDCLRREELRPDCYLCEGTGFLPEDQMEAVIRYLNYTYERVPDYKTPDEWEVERITILYSISGYYWHYGREDQFETVGTELYFSLPILDPVTGRAIPMARKPGKVDRLVRHKETGLLYVFERKSTVTSLDSGQYWDRVQMDGQVSMYLSSLRQAQKNGELEKYGIAKDDPPIQGIYYDVWHKPGIGPKMLSQKDSKAFVESGEYFGQKFEVTQGCAEDSVEKLHISGKQATVKHGAKEGTFTIFETPEMFGARLLSDISERPEFYFAQREIARTDAQLARFDKELANMLKIIRYMAENNLWYINERSCETPFYCSFRSVCKNNIELGPEDLPEGFKRYVRKSKSN